MSRPEFRVLLSRYDLSNYLSRYNVDPYYMGLPGTETELVEITPEDLARWSRHIVNFGSSDKVLDLASFYGEDTKNGEDFTEAMTGHIADEILDECCRTVFEFNE